MDIANRYCRNKAAKSGSSFYYSFLFLPPPQRQAIMAVYAFCREIDDVVDDCTDKAVAFQTLAWWESEIERSFAGTPEHPIGKALQLTHRTLDLPKSLFLDLLTGMRMDLNYHGYESFEDLRLYCHHVASVPGLLAARIFGYTDSNTEAYAKNLGIAFQLVNIIRDVGEDAALGRIYLPEDELARFSVKPESIFARQFSPDFQALMQFQASRARDYYAKALTLLPAIDKTRQQSGLIMAEIYFTLLSEIEKQNFQVLHQKISLTPLRKLWIAWKTRRRLRQCA